MSKHAYIRILSWTTALICLMIFGRVLHGRLNRFAAERMNLLALVEIGELDALDYILKWTPERASERGLFYDLEIDPGQVGDDRLIHHAHEYTPLGLAVVRGHRAILIRLLEAGIDPDTPSIPGGTPLQLAAAHNRVQIVEDLLNYGAATTSSYGVGLDSLEIAIATGHEQVATILMAHGARLDIARQGPALLLAASANGLVDLVRELLTQGVDVQVMSDRGETPLHLAARHGQVEVARILLDQHAVVNAARRGGVTPLHLAIMRVSPAMVELLLAHGADVNQADLEGWTPLHYAVNQPKQEILEMLLEKGPNQDVVDQNGRRPVDYALGPMADLLKSLDTPIPAFDLEKILDNLEPLEGM